MNNDKTLLSHYSEYFNFGKKAFIDFAFQHMGPGFHSFADCGGVWKIEGSYTFYTLDTYKIEKAFLIDTNLTPIVRERSANHENLMLINENFGNRKVLDLLGNVDVIFLFDVLIHQVNPDWDDILKMYAPITK